MQRSGSWLASSLILLVGTMQVEVRGGAGDPPKGLAPPVVDGPFLRPAEGKAAEPTWVSREASPSGSGRTPARAA